MRRVFWFWLVVIALFFNAALAQAQITSTTVTLAWTAPGDDSLLGTATTYELRYSTTAITSLATFLTGTRSPVFAPHVAGAAEVWGVTGLLPSTTYWFAIRAGDEVPNWSGLSNVVTATTLAPPPDTTPPGAVTTLRVRP